MAGEEVDDSSMTPAMAEGYRRFLSKHPDAPRVKIRANPALEQYKIDGQYAEDGVIELNPRIMDPAYFERLLLHEIEHSRGGDEPMATAAERPRAMPAQVGERRRFGDQIAEWDGDGWVPVEDQPEADASPLHPTAAGRQPRSFYDQGTDELLRNPLTASAGFAMKALPGGLKGVANTVSGLGEMVHRGAEALGIAEPTEAFEAAREQLQPGNPYESAGMAGEQIAEFVGLPVAKGSALLRAVQAAATSGALTGVQGGSAGESLAAGGLSAIPAGRIVEKGAEWIGSKAAPLVRAAIKPTVAAMRRVAGVSGEGLDAKAQKLVRFIVDNRLTTPEKAQKVLAEAERELQRLLSVRGAPTDAPQRALRYLDSLERQAAKAGLVDDARAIRGAAEEVFASDMGINVRGLPGARALRPDVPAKEALDLARTRSRLRNRKQWGELKTSSVEASKAIERAQRDAVKAAVPEAKPILQREGEAIRAREILDRMEFRSRNRDAVSLPAHVIAAGEIASGRVPILAFAANWLRNNQLKAGILANDLSRAIKSGNAPRVAEIMQRIGVAQAKNLSAEDQTSPRGAKLRPWLTAQIDHALKRETIASGEAAKRDRATGVTKTAESGEAMRREVRQLLEEGPQLTRGQAAQTLKERYGLTVYTARKIVDMVADAYKIQ